MQQGGVFLVHEEPVTKAKRVTDTSGAVVSAVEVDPFGADTTRSGNSAFQPRKFTTYERDMNGTDEAMFRRYNRWHTRFDQPDPYDGSYDLTDPQSLNRYAYVQNDPVNFVDPAGLNRIPFIHFPLPPNLIPGVGFSLNVYGRSESLAAALAQMGFGRGNVPPITEFEPRRVNGGGTGPQKTATPQLPRGTPQDTIDAFNKAFKEALERLEKEKCAKLFGGKDKAIEALSGANYRVLPLGAPKVDRNTGNVSVVGAATYQGNPPSVFINSQGPFQNTRMNIPGVGFKTLDFGTGLRGADFGALILLHELGHVVGIFKPDAGNEKLNRSYTNQVLKNCF